MNFFKGFKEGQKEFGETIAIIVNSILLSFVYFIGIGLTSIIRKSLGKRLLDLEINSSKESYWEEMENGEGSLKEAYRQF